MAETIFERDVIRQDSRQYPAAFFCHVIPQPFELHNPTRFRLFEFGCSILLLSLTEFLTQTCLLYYCHVLPIIPIGNRRCLRCLAMPLVIWTNAASIAGFNFTVQPSDQKGRGHNHRPQASDYKDSRRYHPMCKNTSRQSFAYV